MQPKDKMWKHHVTAAIKWAKEVLKDAEELKGKPINLEGAERLAESIQLLTRQAENIEGLAREDV